jgi:hypothetical protein
MHELRAIFIKDLAKFRKTPRLSDDGAVDIVTLEREQRFCGLD